MEDNYDEITKNLLRKTRQRKCGAERNPDSELRNEVSKKTVIEMQEENDDGCTKNERVEEITPVKLKGLAALKAKSGTKIERKALVELPCTQQSEAGNSTKSFGLRALRAMPVMYDNEVSLENPNEQKNLHRPSGKSGSPKKCPLSSPKVGSEKKSRIIGRGSDSTENENPQKSTQSVCMDPIVKSLEAQGYTKTESKTKIVYNFGDSPMKKSQVSLKTDTTKNHGSPVNNKPKVLHYFGEAPSKEPFQTKTNAPLPVPAATPKRAEPSPVKPEIPKNMSPLKGNDTNSDIRRIPQVAAERARKIQEMEAARVAKMKSGGTPTANPELRSVSEKAIMFESAATPRPKLKDPAELTLSERKKFFESQMQTRDSPKINSPSHPSPKAALVTSAKKPASRQISDSLNAAKCMTSAKEEPPNSAGLQRFQKIAERLKEKETENKNTVGSTIKDKINAIYGSQKTESSPTLRPPIVVSASPKKACAPPPPPPLPIDNESMDSEEEVSENPDSDNYSDTEKDNNLDQSMALNSSFAFDILTKAGIQVENKRKSDGSSEQSTKIVKMEEPVHHQPLSPIFSGSMETDTDYSENDAVEMPKTVLQPSTALDYSLSLYRKQQTPIRKVVRAPEPTATRKNERETVSLSAAKHQIEALKFEVEKQENVMGQAALALTVCRSTEEFSGSSEQVEGEKLLLVAGLKRTAALSEIERLKTACALEEPEGNSCGTLSLSYISLGLKDAFIQHLNDGFDQYVHHFIVVLRCRGQAIATQMISTTDEGVKENGCLAFPNLIQFTQLTPEFNVALEVYALQSNKEKFSHDVKYHRKKEKSSLWLTPKKLQKTESKRASMRNETKKTWKSSFGLVGYVAVNRNSLKRKEWSLENVPAQSPLDGSLKVNIQCHGRVTVEERGFLTVFDEVQGFGAWHRRWCVLSGKRMAFWKYPDDEKRKEPMSIINLRDCITPEASAVPRELCARPNTFMLVLSRPTQSGDSNSLVMTIRKNRTLTSHKLSADSKEERTLWCEKVNAALKEMRAWDMDALEPSDNCQF